ncbi:hypothetical protein RB195_008651 [Necator americanus]|uniref:Uncharacterized protein n=1 Tax=Necator americanus TaxID=51031 RepID=A0ABR1CPN6_NECAM
MVARKRPPGSSSGSKSGTQLDTPDIDKVPDPSIRSEKYDEEELDEIWYNVKTFFLGCFVFLLFGIMITSCAMGFWMLIAATLKKQGERQPKKANSRTGKKTPKMRNTKRCKAILLNKV